MKHWHNLIVATPEERRRSMRDVSPQALWWTVDGVAYRIFELVGDERNTLRLTETAIRKRIRAAERKGRRCTWGDLQRKTGGYA